MQEMRNIVFEEHKNLGQNGQIFVALRNQWKSVKSNNDVKNSILCRHFLALVSSNPQKLKFEKSPFSSIMSQQINHHAK